MRSLQIIVKAVVLVVAVVQFTGCSMVGLGTGAYIDSKKEDGDQAGQHSIDSLQSYDEVTVHLENGSTVTGSYVGMYYSTEASTVFIPETAKKELSAELRGNQATAENPMLIFQLGSARSQVSLDQIALIEATADGRSAKLKGFALGLVVDAAVVAYLASQPGVGSVGLNSADIW